MTDQARVPDPETSKRLLANLRQARLEMQEFNLELAEITAKIEHDIRQQRLAQVRRRLNNSAKESPISLAE